MSIGLILPCLALPCLVLLCLASWCLVCLSCFALLCLKFLQDTVSLSNSPRKSVETFFYNSLSSRTGHPTGPTDGGGADFLQDRIRHARGGARAGHAPIS